MCFANSMIYGFLENIKSSENVTVMPPRKWSAVGSAAGR